MQPWERASRLHSLRLAMMNCQRRGASLIGGMFNRRRNAESDAMIRTSAIFSPLNMALKRIRPMKQRLLRVKFVRLSHEQNLQRTKKPEKNGTSSTANIANGRTYEPRC